MPLTNNSLQTKKMVKKNNFTTMSNTTWHLLQNILEWNQH
jgi:hypothetical protein